MEPGETTFVHYERPRSPARRILLVILLGVVIAGIDFLILREFTLDALSVILLGVALVSFYIIVSLMMLRHVFSDIAHLPKIEVVEQNREAGMHWEPTPSAQTESAPVSIKEMDGTPVDKMMTIVSKPATHAHKHVIRKPVKKAPAKKKASSKRAR